MAGRIAVAGMASDDDSVRSASPASDGDERRKKAKVIAADIDEDELFELDIALLDGRSASAAVAADDEDKDAGRRQQQHVLLANCLLPVQSVSKAVPVDTSSALWSYPYYSGYYSSRRLVFAGGGGIGRRQFLLGRLGNSARFCFSSRGFDAYFQRY
ncbi:unnamed protein product [Urochloa decumbens]|uniref:Uncharacterized protein n=1 Tax=Urochloa decumbens TaxID=240449 RepID=A0ABC8W890_9POAL